jgi:subtilisin family serine protease
MLKTKFHIGVLLLTLAATVVESRGRVMEPMLALKVAQNHGQAGLRMQAGEDGEDGDGDEVEVAYLPLIIKLTEEGAELPKEVVEIRRRGLLVLAYVPMDQLDAVAELGVVARIEGSKSCVPSLDKAREFTHYPEVMAATDLPQQYTGKGVIAGFSDIGFDPNHIAFQDEQTGQPRVKMLSVYTLDPGRNLYMTTPDEIRDWKADTFDEWHATNVAGILAGGYKGAPYYGIATEADIAASVSTLYAAEILAGMDDVVEFAKQQGKPAVVNMSIAEPMGPHDGTSLFCQYLEQLGKDATICVSAGNYGYKVAHWFGTFPEDCSAASAVVNYHTWSPATSDGYVDIWSKDDSTFGISVIVLDLETEQVAARIPLPEITREQPEATYAVVSSDFYVGEGGVTEENAIVSQEFAQYLKGKVMVYTEKNSQNNRFNALCDIDVENHRDENDEIGTRYLVGIELTGKKGQHFDAYTGESLRIRTVNGTTNFARASMDGSINDFITGNGVIGVGALCSRNTWPILDGDDAEGDYTVGDVVKFSSYWTSTVDGSFLPDIVAPGAYVVSAMSSPYLEMQPEDLARVSDCTEVDGQSYYWSQMSGTSMSSPYVAGVCALMCQANPDATPAQIKDAILSTATQPTVNITDPRWGKGILDSHAAISKILEVGGLNLPRVDAAEQLPTSLTTAQLAELPSTYRLYNLQGRLIPTTAATPGLYILHTPTASGKLLVR